MGLVAVSNAISGLAPATAYHFLLAGTNSAGTNLGGDLTFVTLDIPRAISNVFFASPGQLCLQFNGGPNGSYTVLTTTNLGLSLSNWTSLGPAALLSNNIYQLIDSHATNAAQFYMLKSP